MIESTQNIIADLLMLNAKISNANANTHPFPKQFSVTAFRMTFLEAFVRFSNKHTIPKIAINGSIEFKSS